jgi:Protein involved in formate dehydrogenase formation
MTFLATARVNYQARVLRAELLAAQYPFAAEVLGFYGQVAALQREFHEHLLKSAGKRAGGQELRSESNVGMLLENAGVKTNGTTSQRFGDFLSMVERRGPSPLAAQARLVREKGPAYWAAGLVNFWKAGLPESGSAGEADTESQTSEVLETFLLRAFVQPFAEFLVGAMLPPVLPMTSSRCPRCNSLPLLGVLRPEGDGGKRFLQCSFCSQEWEFRRIFCAWCGEEDEHKLAVYVAEEFPHVRVETCETCKRCLRTIDLTKDGHAVPLVDDLAAIPLTLWAQENGYKRIQENLFAT